MQREIALDSTVIQYHSYIRHCKSEDGEITTWELLQKYLQDGRGDIALTQASFSASWSWLLSRRDQENRSDNIQWSRGQFRVIMITVKTESIFLRYRTMNPLTYIYIYRLHEIFTPLFFGTFLQRASFANSM